MLRQNLKSNPSHTKATSKHLTFHCVLPVLWPCFTRWFYNPIWESLQHSKQRFHGQIQHWLYRLTNRLPPVAVTMSCMMLHALYVSHGESPVPYHHFERISWDIVNNISYHFWIFLVFSGHFLSRTSCYGETPLTHIIANFGRRTATSRHLKPRPPGKMFRITHTFERDPTCKTNWTGFYIFQVLHSNRNQHVSNILRSNNIALTSLCKHTHFWTENT